MIRGSKVVITYDPIEFPPIVKHNLGYNDYFQGPDVRSSTFKAKFADQLLVAGDIIVENPGWSRKERHFIYGENNHKDFSVKVYDSQREKNIPNSIEIIFNPNRGGFSFIKRTDLLPYFVDIGEVKGYEDCIRVDGHYFTSLTAAFHSMFEIDGDRFTHKLWKPYHNLVANVDLHTTQFEEVNSKFQLTLNLKKPTVPSNKYAISKFKCLSLPISLTMYVLS